MAYLCKKKLHSQTPLKQQRTEMTTNKRYAIIITIAAALCIAAVWAGFLVNKYYITRIKTISIVETSYLHITPEDSTASIRCKLEELIAPASAEGFEILSKHNNFDKKRRSGRFAIKDGDTMKDIYYRIVSNTQTPVKLIVPATRELSQLTGSISRQLMMDSTELAEFMSSSIYKSKIGYTVESFPSLFIPETYEVYWNIKPEDLMIRFMKERKAFWNETRRTKAEKIGLTPEEVATLASIVDEETNDNSEKPIVAGLYINRLKRGMPLQADPTVKYALGDPTRKRILNKDLEVESPYNTYKHTGLPPGPIRIASKQGLESVLNYKEHDYLYMCAKEDFSGTHNFAKTLSEHNANAKKYQNALNKLKIKK